jgi:hypothetical protein
MADVDEAPPPADTIRQGEMGGWAVWSAAAVIAALAMFGLYLGLHSGRPAAGVGLAIAEGQPLNTPTPTSAAPAQALSKDQQWSTLSGPAVLPKPKPRQVVASDDTDGGDEDSGGPDDQSMAADQADQPDVAATPQPPPAAPSPPAPQAPEPQPPP